MTVLGLQIRCLFVKFADGALPAFLKYMAGLPEATIAVSLFRLGRRMAAHPDATLCRRIATMRTYERDFTWCTVYWSTCILKSTPAPSFSFNIVWTSSRRSSHQTRLSATYLTSSDLNIKNKVGIDRVLLNDLLSEFWTSLWPWKTLLHNILHSHKSPAAWQANESN